MPLERKMNISGTDRAIQCGKCDYWTVTQCQLPISLFRKRNNALLVSEAKSQIPSPCCMKWLAKLPLTFWVQDVTQTGTEWQVSASVGASLYHSTLTANISPSLSHQDRDPRSLQMLLCWGKLTLFLNGRNYLRLIGDESQFKSILKWILGLDFGCSWLPYQSCISLHLAPPLPSLSRHGNIYNFQLQMQRIHFKKGP